MERRDFLSFMSVSAATLVVGGALPGCTYLHSDIPGIPAEGLKLDLNTPTYAGLRNIGGVVTVNNNIIVAHVSSGEYVALTNICTHQGCTVGFDGASGFDCPCHNSRFAQDGSVINGPAIIALKKYTVSLVGNVLTITE